MATLRVKLLREGASAPERASDGSIGYDLRLCTALPLSIPPCGRALAPTGLAMELPLGTYGRIAPRSGLAVREGLSVGAGVIDRDYRGEVQVLLFNHSDAEVTLQNRSRIAQLILERAETPPVVVVDALSDTQRGSGGFGSTGCQWLPLRVVESYVDEARDAGVSVVARGRNGFVGQYRIHKTASTMKPSPVPGESPLTWEAKRRAFIARHLPQYTKNPTRRRGLALIMWAFMPHDLPSE